MNINGTKPISTWLTCLLISGILVVGLCALVDIAVAGDVSVTEIVRQEGGVPVLCDTLSEDSYLPEMTQAEQEEMWEKSHTLVERFTSLMEQYGNSLSREDQFRIHSYLGNGLILNMASDWHRFEADINTCKSIEGFREILHSDYVGINTSPNGKPEIAEAIACLTDILTDTRLSSLSYHAINYDGFNGQDGQWVCYSAGDQGMSSMPFIFDPYVTVDISFQGFLRKVNALWGQIDYSTGTVEALDIDTQSQLLNGVATFLEKWGPKEYSSSEKAVMIQSPNRYHYGQEDEALIGVWIYLLTDAREPASVSTDQNSAIGSMLVIGQISGRIYSYSPYSMYSAFEQCEELKQGLKLIDTM